MGENEAEFKLTKTKIQLLKENPFYAYLSLFLKFKEDKTMDTMGVDKDGNLYYSKEFVEGLSIDELKGVFIHEILHLSFLHLLRLGSRERLLWNIATDITANSIITQNNFNLPKGCFIPDSQDKINVFGQVIKDISTKTAEQIYDEFNVKVMHIKMKGCGGNSNTQFPENAKHENYEGSFDNHIQSEGMSESEKRDEENLWKGRVEEAYTSAKMRGDIPKGIERLIGKLHESQINWRTLLQRYILSYLPYDYTYSKPNKKSVSTGYYMPDYLKEKIKVVVAVDVSGSIGQEELNDFISEVVGMARAYRERITFRFLSHDTEVQSNYLIENGNIEKIKQIQIKGGGGTSHISTFDYIKEKEKETKVAVFFTDGYSDLEQIKFRDYPFYPIIVLSKNSNNLKLKNDSKIISLK